jgi:hypothetical protein
MLDNAIPFRRHVNGDTIANFQIERDLLRVLASAFVLEAAPFFVVVITWEVDVRLWHLADVRL